MAVATVNVVVPSSGDGPVADVSALVGPKTVVLTGSFQGRYTLLASHDNSHFDPVLQFSAGAMAGISQTVPGAFKSFRLRAKATPLGTVKCDVSAVSAPGQNSFATVGSLPPGFSGSSAVVDLAPIFTPTGPEEDICFLCRGDFRGQLDVLGSLDGVRFNPVGAFRTDGVPSGQSGDLEFEVLTTLDKTRYVRLDMDGVAVGTVTVTIGGRVPSTVTPPAPTPPIATWSLDVGRYIFLDGDNGNDANIGYIDAPLGTVFTPAQAAAVAVKTTHRINEIRPPVGAGRMVIVLMKPRANDVSYDLLVEGDALGSDDRSDCEDYTLIFTRASDLTNSMADRTALGFVTAVPGPNVDGSFTIATVGSGTFGGTLMTLTGATLPAGWELTKYRLRYVTSGSTFYGSVVWGDPSDTPDPTTILANLGGPNPSPGDEIWIERPSLVLHAFFEAVDCSNAGRFRQTFGNTIVGGQLRAYGLYIRGGQGGAEFRPGTRVAGATAFYSSIWVDGPSGAIIVTSECGGSIYVSGSVSDEEGHILIFSSFGMWGPKRSYFGGILTEMIHVENSSFAESGDPVSGQGVVFNCKRLTLIETAAATITLGDNFGDSSVLGLASVGGLRVGALFVVFPGHTFLASIRLVPPWISSSSPKGLSISPIEPFLDGGTEVELFAASVFWGSEIAEPGVTLSAGMYTFLANTTDLLPGTGFRLLFDTVFSPKEVVSTWGAVSLTGFEIPGGLKLVAWNGAANPNAPELCPRGVVMQMVDAEGGGTVFPVGLVVGAVGPSAPQRFDLAGSDPGQPVPTGILLTDCVQGGGSFPNSGFAVVGADGYMVGRLTTPASLDDGTLLYVDSGTPGYLTPSAPANPISIGRILPIGTPSGQTYPVAWEPSEAQAAPSANWSLDLARYIFLDGDSGDDANLGYVNAPLGTIFTPAQTAAVAVKTTHRINELRPPVGAGRMVIVLLKPRANDVSYDLLVEGDALGSDDRSDCEGYTLMITRASDLTNSMADRTTLGFVTAVPGPNVDGSFTVATVGSGTYGGTLMTLTGATLPAGWDLTRYRLRYVTAGNTFYGSVVWGDPSDTPDPTTVLANLGGPNPVPGDEIWFEKPSLVLHAFFEAIDCSNIGRFRQNSGNTIVGGQLRAYGLWIRGGQGGAEFRPGTRVAGATAFYSSIWVDGPSGALILTSECGGSIYISGSVADEEGHILIFSSFGMWGPKRAYFGGILTEMIHVENASFAESGDPVTGQGVVFDCKRLTVLEVDAATITLGDNFGDSSVLGLAAIGGLRVGSLFLVFPGHTSLSSIRFVPPWLSNSSPKGLSISPISQRISNGTEVELIGSSIFWGVEIPEPGVTLSAGLYTFYADHNDLLPGTGFRLLFDSLVSANEVVSTWGSAGITGFEIEGGLKLVSRDNNVTPSKTPLCPRGVVMQMVESEGGGAVFPAGLVVGAVGASAPLRFDLAGSDPGQPRPLGILLTDCTQGGGSFPNNGFAVVGADGFMVARMTVAATLDAGTLLYLDPTSPGNLTPTPNTLQVGRILPVGTPSGQTYPVAWQPMPNVPENLKTAVTPPVGALLAYVDP